MLDLAQTQRLFWDAVVAKKPVRRAELEDVFIGDTKLDVVERLEIYAGMYVRRLVDALAAEFPALKAVVGDAAFEALAHAYLEHHPSEHHSIAHVGRVLAPFIRRARRLALGRRHPVIARVDLGSLADLERRRSLAFDTRDVAPADFSALTSLPAERLPRAMLEPVPSLSLATYQQHVTPIWRAAVDGTALPAPRRGVEQVMVYRQGFTVRHRAVDRAGAVALRALLLGQPLEVICASFSRDADPMASAIACMREWFALGLIASVGDAA